jgi:diguanylate cyclase (GGDEF)-like protein
VNSGNLPLHGVDRLLLAVQELSMARTLEQVVEIVRHAARDLCGADGATFVLREDDKCYYVDEDAIEPLWRGMRFPLEICISGWAMLHKQPAVVPDIYQDARIPHEAYRPTFVKSLAMVPIRSVDPVGAIGNYWAAEHPPTEEEVRLLQALADSTSVALENVSVYAELAETQARATTDELTGLLNRRGFALSAQATLDAAHAAGVDALLLYVDLNGLKQVNDAEGHQAGDALIRAAADTLRSLARDGDLIARMGGDEFCALAIDLPVRGQAVKRRLVEELTARGVSAAIGYVEVGPASELSVAQLVDLADARMYAEKAAGAER